MAFKTFVSGVDTTFSTELNTNFGLTGRKALIGDNSNKIVSFDFSSDQALTKTNLTYDSTDDTYSGSNAAIVLEMPSRAGGQFNGAYNTASLQFNYDVYTVYDECSNSSFDTTKFGTTGGATNSEDTNRARTTKNVTATSIVLNPNNNGSGWSDNRKFASLVTWTSTNDSSLAIRLVGTTSGSVDLFSASDTGSGTFTKFIEVWVDYTNDLAVLYIDKAFNSVTSISSLTGNYYLSFYLNSDTGVAQDLTIDCYYVRIKSGSETTVLTESFSSNGGANYTSASNGNAVLTANTGYATRIKLTGTVAASEVVMVKDCSYLPLVG